MTSRRGVGIQDSLRGTRVGGREGVHREDGHVERWASALYTSCVSETVPLIYGGTAGAIFEAVLLWQPELPAAHLRGAHALHALQGCRRTGIVYLYMQRIHVSWVRDLWRKCGGGLLIQIVLWASASSVCSVPPPFPFIHRSGTRKWGWHDFPTTDG
jgi:hypothetical protein